jgi:hypothetical protein
MLSLLRSLGDALAQTFWATILGAVLIAIGPVWAAVAGAPGYLIFTLALVALASSLVIIPKLSAFLRGTNNSAHLRLHIHADERDPTRLLAENIFRFYQLRNFLLAPPPRGRMAQGASVIVFVAFQNDVRITTLEVSSPDMVLPAHEVNEYNQRFAIVSFLGELPGGTLELRVGF